MDAVTEALIQRGMEQLMEGRTTFVIAHRLSTIKRADRILVIENGGISELGTHAELLRKRGHHYKLYTQQFRQERALVEYQELFGELAGGDGLRRAVDRKGCRKDPSGLHRDSSIRREAGLPRHRCDAARAGWPDAPPGLAAPLSVADVPHAN